ncbi:MAG: 4-alpha-glucanotransferase, partial [Phototrophicaceae bacterium]
MTEFTRSSGILLHPTSLPGRYGIGDLGHWAYRFVDYLVDTEQTLWQTLPLNPTAYADSPYQSPCAFAGNPNIISLDMLVGDGYLTQADLEDVPAFPAHTVDYGWIIPYHTEKLKLAFTRFEAQANPTDGAAFTAFCSEQANWLNDYGLYMAFKEQHELRPWTEWSDPAIIRFEAAAIAAARQTHAATIRYHQFTQWVFYKQWRALRGYAAERGIKFVGDLPIFIAADSSDVWGNQDLFYLNTDGTPTVIAGVPPDYFSETGQRWGNPLYRWDKMKANGYAWWVSRLKATFELVDFVRVDHFRGFEAYWEIPGTEPTAVRGTWVKGPGHDFFNTIKEKLGALAIIAEDLGVITPEVEDLRDGQGLPGMQVLQFAFDGECGANPFLPHHYPRHTVAYTGTHDNNTTVGWWNSAEAHDGIKWCVANYLGKPHPDALKDSIHWEMIRLAWGSVARVAIAPMQDLLGLGAEARMNTPGMVGGWWTWRITEAQFNDGSVKDQLGKLTRLYSR